ncbi:SPX domain-containing protein [Crucibulum laeve]|uniref:SPX domain-containing protein n=1 Tax=Crucibulum laeve TaxID=68775 RepID=A0A5C3LNN7_9AGAR|nr:SPX domain-containing protein [Crucibulum laeve]
MHFSIFKDATLYNTVEDGISGTVPGLESVLCISTHLSLLPLELSFFNASSCSPRRDIASSLKFNAVSDWWDEYIAYVTSSLLHLPITSLTHTLLPFSYDTLKKYIYQLEKAQHGLESSVPDLSGNQEAGEYASLLPAPSSTSDSVFVPLLDRELKKITLFYETQERELMDELTELEEAVQHQEELGLEAGDHYMDHPSGEEGEDEDDRSSISGPRSPDETRRRSASGHRKSTSSVGRRYSITGDPPSPVQYFRRHSVSSLEEQDEEGGDDVLQDSLISLRQHSPTQTHQRFPSLGRQSGTLGKLSTKFNNLRDSITSAGRGSSDEGGRGGWDHNIWTARTDYAYDTRMLFKRRITNLYISFTNLRAYVEINYSGFRKIIKKYDKVTYSELKDRYLHEVVELAPPFTQASKDRLNDGISTLVSLYAKCVTRSDKVAAKTQLRLHQRESIAWERDTVWRQMIGRERRGEGDGILGTGGATVIKEPEEGIVKVGGFRVTKRMVWMAVAALVFVGLLNANTVDGEEANRCFAVLVFCTILWASEAIPLFVTSMFVPLLLVLLRIIRDEEGVRLKPHDATKYVFSIMFSPTIMLLIGGFTISSALSKTNIDRVIITRVLALAGTRPSTVLLAFMGVSCFASMWISNVAAPTLCFTLIRLAIALAANIGGQSSPISSPQNLIAIGEMDDMDWAKWFAVALPVSAISILLIWLLLLVSYRPARSPDGDGEIEIKTIRPTKEPFSLKQYWVTFVCLFTIALWCVEHEIEEYVGDMGVIAIIPIVAFFSTGVLKKDDFEHFMWTIVFLAMGGIALGKGVMSSGLLDVMDVVIHDILDGYSLYKVVLILSPIVLIISTFISHTIASVLLVPIAKQVGTNLPGNHSNLLIFITGLICSAGMGMPVSGFPNQTAATQEDELGELYLTNVDFLKNGVPASIMATMVVSTVGFLLMKLIG